MTDRANWWSVPVFAVFMATTPSAFAQPLAEQTVEVDGETLSYSIRPFPAGVNVVDPEAVLAPTSALDTARLLNRYLTAGKVEDAALLSNAPRRRFEVLADYKNAVGDDGFREVFTEYFNPANRLVAEVIMGSHSLLVWYLAQSTRYAGQYYVEVEGKVFIDDVPNPTRTKLRRVLEAIRAGRLTLP
jgi:hypothetical protein